MRILIERIPSFRHTAMFQQDNPFYLQIQSEKAKDKVLELTDITFQVTVGIKTCLHDTHTYACVCIPKRAPKKAEKKEMGQREQPHCLCLSEGVDSPMADEVIWLR